VTPRLVDPMACDQVPKCLPGEETRSPDDFELFLERILEAPRGARQVVQGIHYVPAFKNSPTCGTFPCSGHDNGHYHLHGVCDVPRGPFGQGFGDGCNGNGCNRSGCSNGNCPGSAAAPAASGGVEGVQPTAEPGTGNPSPAPQVPTTLAQPT